MFEVSAISDANYLAVLLSIVSSIFAGVWSLFQFFIQKWVERRREDQHRETHNLSLFKALADRENDRLQLAAAAVLVERLRGYGRKRKFREETLTIVRALVSILKDRPDPSTGTRGVSPDLSKFIAEKVVRHLSGSRGNGSIADYDLDWQMVTLHGAYWKGLSARTWIFMAHNFMV